MLTIAFRRTATGTSVPAPGNCADCDAGAQHANDAWATTWNGWIANARGHLRVGEVEWHPYCAETAQVV